MAELTKDLILIDEGNKKSYTLNVSPEEFEQANIDPDYGAILLVEYLNAGRPIRTEDIQINVNFEENSGNKENVPANRQNHQHQVENLEDDPLELTINKNKPADQLINQNSAAYNWKQDETFLLIQCYEQEGIHLLVRKQDISTALEKFVTNFNNILLEKKGIMLSKIKCCSKIDSLKRIYREKLDLMNKSGGGACTWPYFETLHKLFHKERWVKPLSVAGSGIPGNLDAQTAETRPKQEKSLKFLMAEISEDRRKKQEADTIKHKEKMAKLDRFNDCMESMAQSFSIIAAAKKAKMDEN